MPKSDVQGVIGHTINESSPWWPSEPRPAPGTPNVVVDEMSIARPPEGAQRRSAQSAGIPSGPRVTRQDEAGLCTLTLSRPDKLNALDTQTFEQLDAHLAALEQATQSIGCVVLRGSGRCFCAGADLQAMGQTPVAPTFQPGVIERLARLPQPTIAAVHGVCYTGGLELALACDFMLADAGARFADTHGKWGLVAAWGLGQRLPRRLGAAAARRMMMTARVVGAEEAQAMGLVDLLAAEGALDGVLAGLAADILANSWHTNFAVKRLMRETDGMPLAQALKHEQDHYPGLAPDSGARLARFGKK